MKKFVSALLAAVLLVSVLPVTALSATAQPTSSTVLINGKNTAFDAYNIDSNNYFKLRDLAFALNGTAKQFDVGWDAVKNAITLTSNKPYTVAGGEMSTKGSGSKSASQTSSTIYLDGKEVSFTAYNIDGNNYFKLRDIGQAFDFNVGWDEASNTVTIDTNNHYDENVISTPVPTLTPAPTMTPTLALTPTPTLTPSPEPTDTPAPKTEIISAPKLSSSDFVISIGGTKIKLGDNVQNAINACGSGYEYSEAVSCVHDGMDKVYTYNDVEFYTYPDGSIDRINEIILTSPAYQTSRGITVSNSIDMVNNAYGNEYADNNQYFVSYKDTDGILSFYRSGDTVTSISIARN